MAEETLFCPSCNQKVRVPEEMLGQPVQCPLCRLVFTAPTRGAAPLVTPPGSPPTAPFPYTGPADRPWSAPPTASRAFIVAPGIALLVVGILGILGNLFRLGNVVVSGPEAVAAQIQQSQEMMRAFMPAGENPLSQLTPETLYRIFIGVFVGLLLLDLLMALGGVQMVRGRGYGLAVLGSVMALLNFFDCICCLLSFPIGLWALIVLLRPGTRGMFG